MAKADEVNREHEELSGEYHGSKPSLSLEGAIKEVEGELGRLDEQAERLLAAKDGGIGKSGNGTPSSF